MTRVNAERASLEQAFAWLDRLSFPIATANVEPARAVGRALLLELRSRQSLPPHDVAGLNGFALQAGATEGAGPYNPMPVMAIPVAAGDPMPPGADAVLPPDLVEAGFALEQAAVGENVMRAASQLEHGALVFPAGHVIRPQDVAVLTELQHLSVVIRFGLTIGGEVAKNLVDLRQALLWRDCCQMEKRADIVLTTQSQPGDIWEIQRIALRPGGETCALGRRHGRPLIRLPSDYLGFALCYELLAARLIRGHAGLGPVRAPEQLPLAGKIVSAIGLDDVVLVRVGPEGATPLAAIETGGAAALAWADGTVVVPATREGFAPGDLVTVHRFAP